jgi:NAD(P)-dependent dehydrogenase (short-subunit alcohol dehydrogenase family)
VLVTGGNRGIGRALALYYAKLGANVVLDGRDESLLAEVVAEGDDLNGAILGLAGDVTDAEHREELVDAAAREFGGVDVLVNNAGVIAEAPLAEMTSQQWRYVLEINLDCVFYMTQLVGTRFMLPRGYGKVINFSSVLGTTSLAGHNNYCASKGGVEQLTRGFAVEWASRGVNVNALAPAYVKTRMNDKYRADPQIRQLMIDSIPAGRFGELEDVVGPTFFFSTALSDFCHGVILPVDGAYLCR